MNATDGARTGAPVFAIVPPRVIRLKPVQSPALPIWNLRVAHWAVS